MEPDAADPADIRREAQEPPLTSPFGRRLAHHRDEVLVVVRAYGSRDVRLFGSVARGDDGPDSDIDLLLQLPANTSLFTATRLEAELSDILGCAVDVVSPRDLRDAVRARIVNEALPV